MTAESYLATVCEDCGRTVAREKMRSKDSDCPHTTKADPLPTFVRRRTEAELCAECRSARAVHAHAAETGHRAFRISGAIPGKGGAS